MRADAVSSVRFLAGGLEKLAPILDPWVNLLICVCIGNAVVHNRGAVESDMGFRKRLGSLKRYVYWR
jgi:hypothetical protein